MCRPFLTLKIVMCVWRPLHLIVCLVVSFDCVTEVHCILIVSSDCVTDVILSFDSVAEVKPTEAWLEQVHVVVYV